MSRRGNPVRRSTSEIVQPPCSCALFMCRPPEFQQICSTLEQQAGFGDELVEVFSALTSRAFGCEAFSVRICSPFLAISASRPFRYRACKNCESSSQASRETSAAYDAHLFEKVATVGQYPEKLKEFRANCEDTEGAFCQSPSGRK